MHSADGSAFNSENLPVDYGLLGSAGVIFVDGFGKFWVETDEIRYTSRMVAMPMSEQYVGECHIGSGEHGGDQISPFWNSLASIDDDSFGTCPNDIGICALECELVSPLVVKSSSKPCL